MSELREKLIQSLDGWRFDQEWTTSKAEDFPEHKGAGCGCGVCRKMEGLNALAVDSFLDAVIEALPKDRRLPDPDKHPHKYWTIKGINAAHKTDRAILTAAKSTNPKEDE